MQYMISNLSAPNTLFGMCLGTQNPLQNHLQKGLEHKGKFSFPLLTKFFSEMFLPSDRHGRPLWMISLTSRVTGDAVLMMILGGSFGYDLWVTFLVR